MRYPIFLAANFSLLALFFITRWLSLPGEIEFWDGEVIAVFLYLTALLFFSVRWHAGQFCLILLFLAAEVFFALFPQWIPKALVDTNPSLLYVRHHRDDIFKYLPESPWIQFKPNTRIRLHGDRGREFVNEWTTDELGFKNAPGLSGDRVLAAVALGDFFTEGIGVTPEDTWPAILGREGFSVFSLGVQGYAPSQAAASYRMYGTELPAPIVIFGYTPGFEKRELNFEEDGRPVQNPHFTAGIQSIHDSMHGRGEKYRYFRFTNTCLHFVKETLRTPLARVADAVRDPQKSRSRFYRYRDFIKTAAAAPYDLRAVEFSCAKKALLGVKQEVEGRGGRVALLLYTTRSWAYTRKITGHDPPPDHFESAVSAMIKDFCSREGIDVIDTHEAIRRYVDALDEAGNGLSDLPYFETDGHHTPAGNRLVAGEVLKYLRGGP